MTQLLKVITAIVLSLTAYSCGTLGSCITPVGYHASLKNTLQVPVTVEFREWGQQDYKTATIEPGQNVVVLMRTGEDKRDRRSPVDHCNNGPRIEYVFLEFSSATSSQYIIREENYTYEIRDLL